MRIKPSLDLFGLHAWSFELNTVPLVWYRISLFLFLFCFPLSPSKHWGKQQYVVYRFIAFSLEGDSQSSINQVQFLNICVRQSLSFLYVHSISHHTCTHTCTCSQRSAVTPSDAFRCLIWSSGEVEMPEYPFIGERMQPRVHLEHLYLTRCGWGSSLTPRVSLRAPFWSTGG